jgi:sortase, srtB family
MAKHFKQTAKKTRRLIYIVLIILIIIATIYIVFFIRGKNNTIQESSALNEVQIDEAKVDSKTTERMLQVQELQKENPDVVGWIEIEETNINYPVLQGTDNSYYMTHNYKKEEAKDGSIFLDKDYDWSIPSSNLLMYGHNMGGGAMFQDLLKYEDEEFYKQHPIVRFTTATEDAEYEIISAFKSRVYYKSEKNVFRYYYFINADNEEEYNEFVNNAKEASFYDTGKDAEYGDQLMTLSTCSYHTEDGRFAVVARKK